MYTCGGFMSMYDLTSVSESKVRSVMSDSLRLYGLQPARLLCPWDSPGENPGVGGHPLLQVIFPTQDRIQVSRIAGGFFTV